MGPTRLPQHGSQTGQWQHPQASAPSSQIFVCFQKERPLLVTWTPRRYSSGRPGSTPPRAMPMPENPREEVSTIATCPALPSLPSRFLGRDFSPPGGEGLPEKTAERPGRQGTRMHGTVCVCTCVHACVCGVSGPGKSASGKPGTERFNTRRTTCSAASASKLSVCLPRLHGWSSVTPSGEGKVASRTSQKNVFCRFVRREMS